MARKISARWRTSARAHGEEKWGWGRSARDFQLDIVRLHNHALRCILVRQSTFDILLTQEEMVSLLYITKHFFRELPEGPLRP